MKDSKKAEETAAKRVQMLSPLLAEGLDQAILLRREVPTRSVAQIIQLLEWEGKAVPGQLKRSTLQGKLTEAGYSTRHLRIYASAGVAARRFQRRHRNELWQSDYTDIFIIPTLA